MARNGFLRYGMIGGGKGSLIGGVHIKAMDLDGNAQIAAGCFSRNYQNSLEVGTELSIPKDRIYKDYLQMAKAEGSRADKLDFVVVVTPNATHYDICRAFLLEGINVVCDKPFTTDLEQALELQALAKEKDLLLCVTYTYSGHLTVKMARALIDGGEIGEVRQIMGEYPQGWLGAESLEGNKQAQWRVDPNQSGNVGTLGDVGTHVENTAYQLTGLKLTRLLARLEQKMHRGLDDTNMILVEFENGATGMYWATQSAVGLYNDLRFRIVGTKGTLVWSQENCEQFQIFYEDGSIKTMRRGDIYGSTTKSPYARVPTAHNEGYIEAFSNVYVAFINAVKAKKAGTFTPDMVEFPTAQDGVAGVRFMQACYESNQKGNVWVTL